MKAVFRYALLGVLLAAAGVGFRTTGQLERRLIDAQKQLVTLKDTAPLTEDADLERSIHRLTFLPWIANIETNMHEQQAASKYWLSNYASLGLQRDSNGEPTEKDPLILLETANATYRTIKRVGNDPLIVKQLNSVMDIYAEVMKRDPGNRDAAYNYEFVTRVRDSLSHPPAPKPGERVRTINTATKAPPKQTVHGIQGAPPNSDDTSPFKILVPKQGDERKEDPEAGKGEKKVRKG
jgi:hypothetical protein